VLGELLNRLSWAGVTPYYFFINRPVAGNRDFVLPLNEVYRIVEGAKARTSGLGKRVRLSMSHTSGKIEILAIENGKAYLKYHQSRDGQYGKFMTLDCPDDAAWFDDLPGNERHWIKPVKKNEPRRFRKRAAGYAAKKARNHTLIIVVRRRLQKRLLESNVFLFNDAPIWRSHVTLRNVVYPSLRVLSTSLDSQVRHSDESGKRWELFRAFLNQKRGRDRRREAPPPRQARGCARRRRSGPL